MVTTVDEVRLVVPARPELMRLARVTAAGLAGRLAFTYDEIEDIRLAIDESCFNLTGRAGREGTVDVVFHCEPNRLVVEGHGARGGAPCVQSPLSEIVLEALVDEHEIGCDRGGRGPSCL